MAATPRMRFGPGAEAAFHRRRDELVDAFATHVDAQGLAVDPADAELLLDWKQAHADGALDVWHPADVEEFLLGWCPRALSAPAQACATLPSAVAAFVEHLATQGLLARASAAPSAIRATCDRVTGAFLRDMADPAKFGMAKSLFATVGGLEPGAGDPQELLAHLDTLTPDEVGAALAHLDLPDLPDGPPVVGPIRRPTDEERRAALADAPDLRRLRELAAWCPAPGRPLTAKGNLRVADARHLADALGTETAPPLGSVRSAEDLPGLTALVELALAAGVVRRQKGRIVAVARFAALPDVAAHTQVLRALLDRGVSPARVYPHEIPIWDALDAGSGVLFALLLTGADVDELVDAADEIVQAELGRLPDGIVPLLVEHRIGALVARLAGLGAVRVTTSDEPCPDCDEPHEVVTPTAAGVPVLAELVESCGIEVAFRSAPQEATAEELAALVGLLEPDEWVADTATWLAAHPRPAAAGAELLGALAGDEQDTATVVAGLAIVGEALGPHAADAVRTLVGGPRDGLALHWLARHTGMDLSGVDPLRPAAGLADLLAVALDTGGPDALMECLATTSRPREFDLLWRLDHPRVADVLEAVGSRHPERAFAKAARRSLMKHRSR